MLYDIKEERGAGTINYLKINYISLRLGEPGDEALAIAASAESPERKVEFDAKPCAPVPLLQMIPQDPCHSLQCLGAFLYSDLQWELAAAPPQDSLVLNPLSCNFMFLQSGTVSKQCLLVYFVVLFIKDKHLMGKTGRQNTNLHPFSIY